jgi:hypothetical protein
VHSSAVQVPTAVVASVVFLEPQEPEGLEEVLEDTQWEEAVASSQV